MKTKILLAVLILTSVFCVAGKALAMTNAEKQALIAQIQAQIAQLTVQLQQIIAQDQGTTNSSQSWCHNFNTSLGFTNTGSDEVSQLHTALQKEGISYGTDSITTYDEDTSAAVVQFQTKYGITPVTGYVGLKTRAKLNLIYGCRADTNPTPTECIPNWSCVNWSACIDGHQMRTCTDSNNCGVDTNKPAVDQACSSVCTPNWRCEDWTNCINDQQTRICTDLNSCGTNTNKPATTQFCTSTDLECSRAKECQDLYNSCYYSCSDSRCVRIETLVALNPYPDCSSDTDNCTPNWTCGNWGTCLNNQQTRTCEDSNECGLLTGKPSLAQSCVSTGPINCIPNWKIGSWGLCILGQQGRSVTDLNGCGVTTNKPATTQSCTSTPITTCNPSWNCGSWGTCVNSQQTRACTDNNYCNSISNKPATTQACSTDWNTIGAAVKIVLKANGQEGQTPANPGGVAELSWTTVNATSCVASDGWTGDKATSGTETISGLTAYTIFTLKCSNATGFTTAKSYVNAYAPNWYCTDWGPCINGQQTRPCTDQSHTGLETGKPATTKSCCIENWSCGGWSACSSNNQTRTCTDLNSCGTTIGRPAVSQYCKVNHCQQVNAPGLNISCVYGLAPYNLGHLEMSITELNTALSRVGNINPQQNCGCSWFGQTEAMWIKLPGRCATGVGCDSSKVPENLPRQRIDDYCSSFTEVDPVEWSSRISKGATQAQALADTIQNQKYIMLMISEKDCIRDIVDEYYIGGGVGSTNWMCVGDKYRLNPTGHSDWQLWHNGAWTSNFGWNAAKTCQNCVKACDNGQKCGISDGCGGVCSCTSGKMCIAGTCQTVSY